MSESIPRSKSIGVKVREAEFATLQALAEGEHKPLAEWCRDTLVEIAYHPVGTPIDQALLAEVIALRTIVANLIYSFTSKGKVTREQSSEVLQSRGCEHQFREACTGFPRDGKARGCQGVS